MRWASPPGHSQASGTHAGVGRPAEIVDELAQVGGSQSLDELVVGSRGGSQEQVVAQPYRRDRYVVCSTTALWARW